MERYERQGANAQSLPAAVPRGPILGGTNHDVSSHMPGSARCCTQVHTACSVVRLYCCTLQASLPEEVHLYTHDTQQSAVSAWLGRNLGRIQHMVVRTAHHHPAEAAGLPKLSDATALRSMKASDCTMLQQLPMGLGSLRYLTSLSFSRW
jgi:hypothetical protein